MNMNRTISLTINGETHSAQVPTRMSLVDFLRDELGLTGTHVGCEHGVCGACTLIMDGEIVRGCLVLAVQAEGSEVLTIEGVEAAGENADLIEAFVKRNALQCGFCTPGMIITASDLLNRSVSPSREEIREHLSGNYCRCTGYEAIVDAVHGTASRRNGGEPQ